MDKTQLLDRAARTSDERLLLARLHDKLEAAKRGSPACTGFLSPAQQKACERFLQAAGRPRRLYAGGWPDAERKVCALLPDWQEEDDWQPPYTALRCRWQAGGRLTHRDLLGAVLGQGVGREKVGDLLVNPECCDILVMAEMAPYLLQNLTGAGRVKLSVEELPLEQIAPPALAVKLIRDTVSSPRLDAVMAAGFSTGRGRCTQLIASGRVELNHLPCVKPDKAVRQGDILTCRGLGKCVVKELGGTSKKGRTIVTLERYV